MMACPATTRPSPPEVWAEGASHAAGQSDRSAGSSSRCAARRLFARHPAGSRRSARSQALGSPAGGCRSAPARVCRRDPEGEPQQVRVRPQARRDQIRSLADERRHVSHRLRLPARHARRGRRSARRARLPDRANISRLPDPGRGDRHVRDGRREGPRRQDPVRPLPRPLLERLRPVEDLPALLRAEIEQFFSSYKELEPRKFVEVGGWRSREEALAEIDASQRRFRQRG
jgi:Inorganic pyrophosphatase